MKTKSFLISLTLISLLSNCASWLPDAHKIDIPQGNKLEQKQIDQLKIGLTKEQVSFLLGSSIMTPNTQDNYWEYLYYSSKAGDKPKGIKQLELFFVDGKLTRFKQTTN